jgi:hypothetical protein
MGAFGGLPAEQADETRRTAGQPGRGFESLVDLILQTPRDRCVPVLAGELRRGLSYRQAMAGLFHAAVRGGGSHEVAMMHSAHRISGDLPVKDALLPLFWAFDSLAHRIAGEPAPGPPARPTTGGPLPSPDKAGRILEDAMKAQDRPAAELAAVSLARSIGSRQTMGLVWHWACRDSDDLGHMAIVCANSWRVLDAIGWEHVELPLRYVLGSSAGSGRDATYSGSLERVEATLPRLAADWCSPQADRTASLELHEEIRAARSADAADLVCEQLTGGNVCAGSVWDAIHLSAADLLYRFDTRQGMRGWPVHSVTSSNALHFAFDLAPDDETRLLLVLQATSRISEQMTRLSLQRHRLRERRITDLEPADTPASVQEAVDEIFGLLPYKHPDHQERDATDREKDDDACRKAFALLRREEHRPRFMSAASEYIARKSTWNAHDFKFPAAAFEDVNLISERWRAHFLAATVHALHGAASDDAPVLIQAREALSTL